MALLQRCGDIEHSSFSSSSWTDFRIASALRTRAGYPICDFHVFFCCVILASVAVLHVLVFWEPYDGRAAYAALTSAQDGLEVRTHALYKTVTASRQRDMGGYGLRRSRPSGLPNTVAAVGMHLFLAGSLGQSHLRGMLHPYSSPHRYCVLAGTSGLAVATTSTTICSIRYACLISRPRRRRWTWRKEAWAGHAPKVRLWRNLGERSVVFSVVRSESLTEVEMGGWWPGRVISYAWDWISGCFPLIGGKRMQVKSCARCIISRNTTFRTLLFFSPPALKPTRTSLVDGS